MLFPGYVEKLLWLYLILSFPSLMLPSRLHDDSDLCLSLFKPRVTQNADPNRTSYQSVPLFY